MDECVKELSKNIICRDSLIKRLYSLLDIEPMFQSIFVYGHVSCGKSLVIQSVLKYLKYKTSIVNCIEHASNRSMFEKIIVDLSSTKLTASSGYKLEKKCDDFVEFISQIRSIAEEGPVVIVLEKCEKLRDMDANLLPALLKLGELTKSNVCTIFTSDVIWEKYWPKMGLYEPVMIHFPQYNKEEIVKILLHLTKSDEFSDQFYDTYLNLFLSVFLRNCRDLNELSYMAKKNFEKYVEPVRCNKIKENDTQALWKNIINVFRSNLEVIYLRMSTDDINQQAKLSNTIESTTKLALSFELPYYAKYLLIAAYLASYNPPKEDKKLFMKAGGPRKKRSSKKKKDRAMTTREGPKSFPLSRLLAIFCSIINENIDLNAILLTQVPTMCQLGLLSVIGDNNLDEPKYKCCVSFEFITVISKNVDFELLNYLYDFLH